MTDHERLEKFCIGSQLSVDSLAKNDAIFFRIKNGVTILYLISALICLVLIHFQAFPALAKHVKKRTGHVLCHH